MEHISPTTIYFQNLHLLADHFKAQIKIKEGGVTIIIQPATYDIPRLLPYLFPTHVCINFESPEDVLEYVKSLPETFAYPVQTLLIIDEHSSPLMTKIQSILFYAHEVHLFGPVLLTKNLPKNLSICIILSRTLIEGHAFDTPLSILKQYHIHAIKSASIPVSLQHRVPLVLDLNCMGKKAMTDMIFRILYGDPQQEPTIKIGVKASSHHDVQQFISITNPISLSSALYNYVFYYTHRNKIKLPRLSNEIDTLYQLIRSLFSASLRDPHIDTTALRTCAFSYINLRIVCNLTVCIPTTYAFLLASTKRAHTKRDLNMIYTNALDSDITPRVILSWLYEYIYSVYYTIDQIGHFCECVSAVYSISDRLPAYSDAFSMQVAWIIHELCVLKFTKSYPLPLKMHRLSSYCPSNRSSIRYTDSLNAYEQYHNLCDLLNKPSESSKHLGGGNNNSSITASNSDSELTS